MELFKVPSELGQVTKTSCLSFLTYKVQAIKVLSLEGCCGDSLSQNTGRDTQNPRSKHTEGCVCIPRPEGGLLASLCPSPTAN